MNRLSLSVTVKWYNFPNLVMATKFVPYVVTPTNSSTILCLLIDPGRREDDRPDERRRRSKPVGYLARSVAVLHQQAQHDAGVGHDGVRVRTYLEARREDLADAVGRGIKPKGNV